MDQALEDLVRQLCTRIGMIMEDEAPTALVFDRSAALTETERFDRLADTGRAITLIAEAGQILVRTAK